MDTIVLVAPPNEAIVLRDMYSSTISKGHYNWPNTDLLVCSGILRNDFNVIMIDAMTDHLGFDETISNIASHNPIGVVCAVGVSVRENDYAFIRALKQRLPDIRIVGSGGILYHNPVGEMKDLAELDACLLSFVTQDIRRYFQNDLDGIENLVYRDGDKIVQTAKSYPKHGYSYSVPLHEQLPLHKYQLSHGYSTPMASVLTSFGCPATCSFCVSGSINYRYRDPSNVIEELDHLNKLGVKQVYFRDNVFLATRKKGIELLEKMVERNYGFRWLAEMRADALDEGTVPLMKATGCYAVHMGVESASQDTLDRYEKRIKLEQYKTATKLCRENGIRTIGYFIIGLPGETREDVLRTIDWALELDVDYASFNAPLPIFGTKLRDEAVEKGWIVSEDATYDGSQATVLKTDELSPEEVAELRNLAYRKFYTRPKLILRNLMGIRTLFQVRMLVIEGVSMGRRLLGFANN